jgi:hypothetical protein
MTLIDEAEEHPLRKDAVSDVQSRELVLVRPRRHRQILDEPVVQRPMVLELERADGMGHALDGVRLTVREVVRGVDAPRVARAGVRRVKDAVHDRVAQVDVARRHVDPRPEHASTVEVLAGPHAGEQVDVLLGRAVAPWAVLAGLGQRAAVGADLVGREVVDVGLPAPDEVDRPLIELLEVVGGEVQVLAPVEPEPADVGLDGVDVLLLFLRGIGVVEAQVAATTELSGDTEVEADRLGVPDVEVAVGLGGEARDDTLDTTLGQIAGDDLADEVRPLRRG